jgi:hypothetical protein
MRTPITPTRDNLLLSFFSERHAEARNGRRSAGFPRMIHVSGDTRDVSIFAKIRRPWIGTPAGFPSADRAVDREMSIA